MAENNNFWGTFLGAMGTAAVNSYYNNKAIDKQNKFNAEQAEIQRQYEAEMSNTAYQRAYDDMKKAGLNPNLAGGQGGASTPSGSAATSAGFAPFDLAGAMNANANAALTHAQLANIEADTTLKNKQSGKTKKETEYTENKMGLETALNNVQIELTKAQTKDAKKAAEHKQQILINQMIQNYYEFIMGRKMPGDAVSHLTSRLIQATKGTIGEADTIYQMMKAEVDKYKESKHQK